jgi:hypothetical protein
VSNQSYIKQGHDAAMLKKSLKTFYDRHYEVVALFEISISQTSMDLVLLCIDVFAFLYGQY